MTTKKTTTPKAPRPSRARYTFRGRKVDSVTEIIDWCGANKRALLAWAGRLAREGRDPGAEGRIAREIGTAVHLYAERRIGGAQVASALGELSLASPIGVVDPDVERACMAWEREVAEHLPRWQQMPRVTTVDLRIPDDVMGGCLLVEQPMRQRLCAAMPGGDVPAPAWRAASMLWHAFAEHEQIARRLSQSALSTLDARPDEEWSEIAGTPDLVELRHDGSSAVWDWKTSATAKARPYAEHVVQVSAYTALLLGHVPVLGIERSEAHIVTLGRDGSSATHHVDGRTMAVHGVRILHELQRVMRSWRALEATIETWEPAVVTGAPAGASDDSEVDE